MEFAKTLIFFLTVPRDRSRLGSFHLLVSGLDGFIQDPHFQDDVEQSSHDDLRDAHQGGNGPAGQGVPSWNFNDTLNGLPNFYERRNSTEILGRNESLSKFIKSVAFDMTWR